MHTSCDMFSIPPASITAHAMIVTFIIIFIMSIRTTRNKTILKNQPRREADAEGRALEDSEEEREKLVKHKLYSRLALITPVTPLAPNQYFSCNPPKSQANLLDNFSTFTFVAITKACESFPQVKAERRASLSKKHEEIKISQVHKNQLLILQLLVTNIALALFAIAAGGGGGGVHSSSAG